MGRSEPGPRVRPSRRPGPRLRCTEPRRRFSGAGPSATELRPLVLREGADVERGRVRAEGTRSRRPARVPVLPDPDGALPCAARGADVPRHETRSPPARVADPRPRRAPPDDPDAVSRRRGAAGESHGHPRPRGRGGRPPDAGARVEPRGEAPPREGGPRCLLLRYRVEGGLAPRIRRGRIRWRMSRESASAPWSAVGSTSPTLNC